jgi:HEAT repeat protein
MRIMADMAQRRGRASAGFVCTMVIAMALNGANATSDPKLMKQLAETIAKVRTSEVSVTRREAAERVTELTRKIDPDEIDDKTLGDLVSLLDSWDDSVVDAAAVSLGNLGPHAKSAVPKLLQTLPEVDCLWVDASSALDIRDAIKRIGAPGPPPPKCETAVDPVVWKKRLADTITKVQTSESSVVRAKAAMHIGYLIFWLGRNTIDDQTVADLVSLLNIPEDPVREGVARSLGFLGPRARAAAAPKLGELLSEVDCRPQSIDSADAIRSALSQMGVKPPHPKCGAQGTTGRAGPPA